jgi:hypothetical protein
MTGLSSITKARQRLGKRLRKRRKRRHGSGKNGRRSSKLTPQLEKLKQARELVSQTSTTNVKPGSWLAICSSLTKEITHFPTCRQMVAARKNAYEEKSSASATMRWGSC